LVFSLDLGALGEVFKREGQARGRAELIVIGLDVPGDFVCAAVGNRLAATQFRA
jgi:hypothetical protein